MLVLRFARKSVISCAQPFRPSNFLSASFLSSSSRLTKLKGPWLTRLVPFFHFHFHFHFFFLGLKLWTVSLQIKIQIAQMVETRRNYVKLHKEASKAVLPEYSFAHLLFVLAMHPDFNRGDPKELTFTLKYLEYFLDFVATQDNTAFLVHVVQSVRRCTLAAKRSDVVAKEAVSRASPL